MPVIVGAQPMDLQDLNPARSLERLVEGGDQIKQIITTTLYIGRARLLVRHHAVIS